MQYLDYLWQKDASQITLNPKKIKDFWMLSTIPLMIQGLKMIPNRFFGVEMETHPVLSQWEISQIIKKFSKKKVIVTGWRQTQNNSSWHVKTDSTCGGGEKNGFEIASYKARGIKDLEHISAVASELESAGLRCGIDCGFHVHVDISDFSREQAAVLLARWIKIEKFMMQSVPSSRRHNRHCRSLAQRISPKKFSYDPSAFWDLYSPRNFSLHSNRDKRVTMNLVNYATCLAYKSKIIRKNFYCDSTRSTVEFRFPDGTFSRKDVNNWILLFLSFVEKAKQSPMPRDLCSVSNFDEAFSFLGLCGHNSKIQECRIWLTDRIKINSRSKKWKKVAERSLCKLDLHTILV